MMIRLLQLTLVLFVTFGALSSEAAESTNLPFSVETAIRDLSKGGTVEEVEQRTEDGERLFDVEITLGEVSRVFTLDREGVPIATEVFENELPAAVQRTLKAELGADGKLEGLTRVFEDGKPVFEAEIAHGGRTNVCTIAANGVVTTREIPAAEVPKVVRASLHQQLKGGRAGGQFYKSVEGTAVYFVASVEYPGRCVWLSFHLSGKLAGREEMIPLMNAPAPVQAAITDRLGNSEHVRVTRHAEGGDTYFEVLALMNGKVQSFFVMPAGKIALTPPQ